MGIVGPGEEEKMGFTCGDWVCEEGWLCSPIIKLWDLAEVRETEEQAQGGRTHEDHVCKEVMDPGFLMTELLLSADKEKHHSSLGGNSLVAVLGRTLPGNSGFSVAL